MESFSSTLQLGQLIQIKSINPSPGRHICNQMIFDMQRGRPTTFQKAEEEPCMIKLERLGIGIQVMIQQAKRKVKVEEKSGFLDKGFRNVTFRIRFWRQHKELEASRAPIYEEQPTEAPQSS